MLETHDSKGRKYLSRPEDGFHGQGHLVCDGNDHWWVVTGFEELKCKEETHVGPCPGNCKPEPRFPAAKGKMIGEK